MFISIKRLMESRSEQLAEALLRMVRLILQGIELHAVKGDAVDYDRFRAGVRKVQDSLSQRPAPSEVLVAAGTLVRALEDYSSSTSRFIHVQCAELQTMVGMLTKAMTSMAANSEATVSRLHAIERQLQKASVIEDFQSARLRLSECLEGLSGEIIRQKEDSARAVGEIKTALEQSQQRLVPRPRLARGQQSVDPVTGLPGRSEAEASVLEASQKDSSAFAALFVIDRLELINMRYGYAVGDQVLLAFSQHVARHLSACDRLFRWSGPALLALLEHRDSERVVREEIERVTSRRLEKTITLGDRTVLLPISADWVIYPVSGHHSVHALFHQLDLLVQGKSVDRPPDEGAEA